MIKPAPPPRKLSFLSVCSERSERSERSDLEALPPPDMYIVPLENTAVVPPPPADATTSTVDATTQSAAVAAPQHDGAAASPGGGDVTTRASEHACLTPRTRRNVLATAAETRAARHSTDAVAAEGRAA